MKDSFILYLNQGEQIELLTDEQAGKLFKGLFSFVANGEKSVFDDGMTQMCFAFISAQIARDAKKYADKCERLSANASKCKQKHTNASKCKQIGSDTDNDNDNDTDTDNVNDTDIYPPKSPKGEKSEIEKRFLQFWEVYPRKQAIANARKAFEKIKPDETLSDTIIKAVEAQKKCEQWQNSKYIPLPASWLNAERWKDETQTATAQRQVNTTPSNISLLDKYL